MKKILTLLMIVFLSALIFNCGQEPTKFEDNLTNTAPYFTSMPVTSVTVNQNYEYFIAVADSTDPPSSLTIEIVKKPGWLNYDATSKKLFGSSPNTNLDGIGNEVEVKVTDGLLSKTQSFKIMAYPLSALQFSSNSLYFDNCTVNTIAKKEVIVSGYGLTSNLIVVCPLGYKISKTPDAGFVDSISFTPYNNSLVDTTIYIRFNPSAVQVYNSSIIFSSIGLTTRYVNVYGKCITTPIPEMILVDGGTFSMGAADIAGATIHPVTLSSFYIGKYEVTQAEWIAIMGTNPSTVRGNTIAVDNVRWYEILVYCNKRSIAENLTPCYTINGSTNPSTWGAVPTSLNNTTWDAAICNWSANGYRLPTEAEWEFAARGGNNSQEYTYSGSNIIGDVAWYIDNSQEGVIHIGTKLPNELGLYDMSGNVFEWNWDWFANYVSVPQTNPTGSTGTCHVVRGGSYYGMNYLCRVNYRFNLSDFGSSRNFGFRLARTY